MIKHYTHLLIILILAWTLYGLCQEDFILAGSAIAIALISYLARCGRQQNAFTFFGRLPLAAILVFSLIAGILWRVITPAPAAASAMYIGILSVWQSAAVVASVLFWLRPYSLANIYWLSCASWVIAALSINVPFDDLQLLVFRLFCIFSVVNILIHTLTRPPLAKRLRMHYVQLLVFGLASVMITGFFFRNIVWGLRVFDEAFMSLVGDYLLPRQYTNFLNISPLLSLTNPGHSAMDRRPVLEIDSHGFASVYLRMQVFDGYNNGVWGEAIVAKRQAMNNDLDPTQVQSRMLMYRAISDIVPTLYGVTAVSGNDTFLRDDNDLVYAKDKRHTRVVATTVGASYPIVEAAAVDRAALTAISETLREPLSQMAQEIVPAQGSDFEKAKAIEDYLRKNFRYTLDVNFHASDKGLIEMLREKKPAYCSYFASALTLLARSQGIPSRVATGFMSQERTGSRGERIVVRVRNAHAWSEMLVDVFDEQTQQTHKAWVPFDGTPSSEVLGALNRFSALNILADKIWLTFLRTITQMQNVDKDKLKAYTLLTLILILIAINLKRILRQLSPLRGRLKRQKRSANIRNRELEDLYRRYEELIAKRFRESRREEETDAELLKKLQNRGVPKPVLYKLHDFIDGYRQARFGEKADTNLKDRLNKLLREIPISKNQISNKSQ